LSQLAVPSGAVRQLVLAVLVTFVGLPSVASAATAPHTYYLALGDSLSVGVQPDKAGRSLETDQGYANQLFTIEQRHVPHLKLVKLGCPGDTTESMLTGRGNETNAKFFHCDRSGGSQLTAAEQFLRAHHQRGEVPLVTIDIGANDVDGCAAPGVNVGQCVAAGEASIKRNLPRILRGIKKAAPAGTVLAGMTLYDPILSGYFSADPSVKALALASVTLAQAVNGLITHANTAAGFKTADVAGAFKTYDTTANVSYNGVLVPVNVATVCSWTWACTPPPSGPNIHANKNGYAVIANAFSKVIGKLPKIRFSPPKPPHHPSPPVGLG
jgi:lysophospholipase L1-like esterase